MKILLAEDRPEYRDTLVEVINDFRTTYNADIEIIAVTSLEDLQCKLFTHRIDGAIIDNNLQLWGQTNTENLTEKGYSICEFLQKISYFKNVHSQVVLYSGNNVRFSNQSFQITNKPMGIDALEQFNRTILEPLSAVARVTEISFKKFIEYSLSQKIAYYKSYIIDKIQIDARFKEFAPTVSWSSDLINEHLKVIVGSNLGQKNLSLADSVNILSYKELDSWISRSEKIPTLMWNFTKLTYFQKQNENIKKCKFQNRFIKLFYDVAFSADISKFILEKPEFIENLGMYVQSDDNIIRREIQCQVIERMSLSGDKPTRIRSLLNKLKQKLELDAVDYFNGELESYDEDSDEATVRLESMIDPQKYFYRTFSYKRLRSNGIKFKESRFRYFISEFQNGVSSYLEPQQ